MGDAAYSRKIVMYEQVRQYEARFKDEHKMQVSFDDEATELICKKAGEQESTPEDICEEILQSCQHGLNLIRQNTGRGEFTFTKEVVENPDDVLESWIRESYKAKAGEAEEIEQG